MELSKTQQQELVSEAAQILHDAGIEPEIAPVSAYLQSIGHEYALSWTFCFCVAVDVANLNAKAEGYDNQYQRAWARIQERRASSNP